MSLKIKVFGMDFFEIITKERQPDIVYENCNINSPTLIPENKKETKTITEKERLEIIDKVAKEVGLDSSTVELVLNLSNEYYLRKLD